MKPYPREPGRRADHGEPSVDVAWVQGRPDSGGKDKVMIRPARTGGGLGALLGPAMLGEDADQRTRHRQRAV